MPSKAPGDANVTLALRSLASQLVRRYRLEPYSGRDMLPQTLSEYPLFLGRLLRMASEKRGAGEKIVLVLDALDEAGTPPGSNVLGLPRQLPEGVYLILSLRPQPVTLDIEPFPHRVDLLQGADENREDVAEYLEKVAQSPAIAGQLAAHGYTAAQFVRALGDASAGNWMYLYYVITDIRGGLRAPLNLDELPRGLTGYYAQTWSRWRDEAKWDSLYLPLLATLNGAFEPLTLATLREWAGIGPDASDRTLRRLWNERWRAFVQRTAETPYRYRPLHASLRDFFGGRATPGEMPPAYEGFLEELGEAAKEAHARIVDRLRITVPGGWPELASDPYASRYLTSHLRLAGDLDTLFWLVDDEEWYNAQERVDPSYAAFLNDIEQAWTAAEDVDREAVGNGELAPLLGREIRCALVKSSLHSLSSNIPYRLLVMLVKTGRWTPATALAIATQRAGESDRARTLSALAKYLPAELSEEALGAARGIVNRDARVCTLNALAKHLPATQQACVLGEALAVARGIEHEHTRAILLSDLAEHLPTELLDEVLETALGNEDKHPATHLLGAVIQHLPTAKRNDVCSEALTTARGIGPEYSRASALIDLAKYLPPAEQTEVLGEALAATHHIEDASHRALALIALAKHLPPAEQTDVLSEALATIRGIPGDGNKAGALSALAEHLPLRLLGKALIIARGFENMYDRARTLTTLVQYLPATEQTDVLSETLAAAREIGHGTARASVLSALVTYFPSLKQADMLDEALAAAREIQDEEVLARTLSALARALAKIGQG